MSITVALRGPPDRAVGRIVRAVLRIVGVVIVLVSAVSLIPAVWIAWLWFVDVGPPGIEGGAFKEFPDIVRQHLLPIWLASVVLAVGGRILGLWLVRRHRRLVIFLRRFGHGPATAAATSAAHRLGRSWRFVTLDDERTVEPVGVSSGVKKTLRGAGKISSILEFLAEAGKVWLIIVATVAGVVTGIFALMVFILVDGGPETRLNVVWAVMAGSRPAVGFAEVGLHACALVLGACLGFALLFVLLGVVFLLSIPVLVLFTSLVVGVGRAEDARAVGVNGAGALRPVRQLLRREARRVFTARLIVLKVDGSVWRPTVTEVAADCGIALIDVTIPSENLVWEIETLSRHLPGRCVFICQHAQAAALSTPPNGTAAARMRDLLAGQTVVAYTADRRGGRQFIRALRTALEQAAGQPDPPKPVLTDAAHAWLLAAAAFQIPPPSTSATEGPDPTLAAESLQATDLAETNADRAGRRVLSANDLWAGLIEGSDPIVTAILDGLGVAPGEISTAAERDSPAELEPVRPGTRYSAQARAVLHLARIEAEELGQKVIRPEHLLLGLLREGDCIATDLDRRGVTADVARRGLIVVLRALGLPPDQSQYASRGERASNAVASLRAFVLESWRGLLQTGLVVTSAVAVFLTIPPKRATCGSVYLSYPTFITIGALAGIGIYMLRAEPSSGKEFAQAIGIGVAVALGIGLVVNWDTTLLSSVRACMGLPV